jgi:hypothetical protein
MPDASEDGRQSEKLSPVRRMPADRTSVDFALHWHNVDSATAGFCENSLQLKMIRLKITDI